MYDRTTPSRGPTEVPLDVDLVSAVDDEDDPRTITVYPRDCEDLTTTWITMDVEHVHDRAEMA